MQMLRTPITSALVVVLAFALAGCGSSSTKGRLSQDQASSLNSALNKVDAAVAAGDCPAASEAAAQVQDLVTGLPSSVDSGLRGNLTSAANNVLNQAQIDCAKSTTSTSSSTTTTSTPTTSSYSTTSSSSTTTTSTTTPTTTTTTTTDGGGAGPDIP